MPENNMNIQSQNERGYCNNSGLGGLFDRNGCCSQNSEILFFIIIFLLLFTNFGCCGCGRN